MTSFQFFWMVFVFSAFIFVAFILGFWIGSL